ncbi:MAG: MurR/RpiR family transcriptional regulator [Bacillaceae bacterium]
MPQQIIDIKAHLNSLYNSLTKSEKIIADFVLKDQEKIVYASITDLANEIGVGESTIIRFCKKLGFQSYQNFKLTLGQNIVNSSYTPYSELDIEIKEDDSIKEMLEKTININISALHETLALLDPNEVQRAVDIIAQSNKVFFCGAGVSEVTARDAAYRLLRIGVNSFSVDNYHFQRMQASLLTPNDVIVGISHSGKTQDVQEVIEIAKEKGAKVICITHNRHSLITKISDVVLLHGSKQKLLQGGALSSKMCQLMIIDCLYNGLFLKLGDVALENKNTTFKSILNRFI